MPTLEEIHEVMNPKSLLMGPTGSSQLDLMVSSAEAAFQRARAECLQLKPLVVRGESDSLQQCMGLISGELSTARQFLASAEAYLHQRKQRAEGGLRSALVRLADISDELIVGRIHTLEVLFDSLNKKDLIPRIEKELREGDSLGVYLLRGGEGWLRLYLESRQIPYRDLVEAISNTASITEPALQSACSEYLTVENLITTFGEARNSIENSFQKLPIEVMVWIPKKPISGNSLDDLPDSHVITAGDLRKFATSGALRIAKGQW